MPIETLTKDADMGTPKEKPEEISSLEALQFLRRALVAAMTTGPAEAVDGLARAVPVAVDALTLLDREIRNFGGTII